MHISKTETIKEEQTATYPLITVVINDCITWTEIRTTDYLIHNRNKTIAIFHTEKPHFDVKNVLREPACQKTKERLRKRSGKKSIIAPFSCVPGKVQRRLPFCSLQVENGRKGSESNSWLPKLHDLLYLVNRRKFMYLSSVCCIKICVSLAYRNCVVTGGMPTGTSFQHTFGGWQRSALQKFCLWLFLTNNSRWNGPWCSKLPDESTLHCRFCSVKWQIFEARGVSHPHTPLSFAPACRKTLSEGVWQQQFTDRQLWW